MLCSNNCKCGTRDKPCRNRELQDNTSQPAQRRVRPRLDGFRLSSGGAVQSEEQQRIKENNDVKDFIATLDEGMVRKLAVRSLRRGVGSMDYIHTLLIMEDDLDAEGTNMVGEEDTTETALASATTTAVAEPSAGEVDPGPSGSAPLVEWCVCSLCRPMPQAIENKCCQQRNCITTSARFGKLCLDPDVLQLCIRNMGDIRNDREDNSTRAFRKAAYRQFILARHGHLGRGNRRVCPSCVVLKIRAQFPSLTGVYMGYREH